MRVSHWAEVVGSPFPALRLIYLTDIGNPFRFICQREGPELFLTFGAK